MKVQQLMARDVAPQAYESNGRDMKLGPVDNTVLHVFFCGVRLAQRAEQSVARALVRLARIVVGPVLVDVYER